MLVVRQVLGWFKAETRQKPVKFCYFRDNHMKLTNGRLGTTTAGRHSYSLSDDGPNTQTPNLNVPLFRTSNVRSHVFEPPDPARHRW